MKKFIACLLICFVFYGPMAVFCQADPPAFIPEPYGINMAPGVQVIPRVYYAGSGDQYLVVWIDYRACHEDCRKADIYGQMTHIDGKQIGSPFRINEPGFFYYNDEGMPPSAAYDSKQNRFLVCWDDREKVFAQLVDPAAPGLVGNNRIINGDVAGRGTSPDVIYNPKKKKFLIAWDNREPYDVFIRGLDKDGQPLGTARSANSDGGSEPAWAYSETSQRFILLWTDGFGFDKDVYYRMVGTDGRFKTFKRAIAALPGVQNYARAAYNHSQNLFIVVWTDDRDLIDNRIEIYGQKILGDGTLIDGNFRITFSNALEISTLQSIDFSSLSRLFLLAFTSIEGGIVNHNVFGQWIQSNGQPGTRKFPIADESYNELSPDVAASEDSANFMVCWDDGRNQSTTRNDIYGRRIKAKTDVVHPEWLLSDETKEKIKEKGKVTAKEINEYWQLQMKKRLETADQVKAEIKEMKLGPDAGFAEQIQVFKKEMEQDLGKDTAEKLLMNPALMTLVEAWSAEKKDKILKAAVKKAGFPEGEEEVIKPLIEN